jgi:hypothetical protein
LAIPLFSDRQMSAGTVDQFSAQIRSLSDLPGESKDSIVDNRGSAGVIHRIECNTASIKFTGTVITGLSDEEIFLTKMTG